MAADPDRQIDARGLLCPLPTVRAALALEEMKTDQILEVLSDDPSTKTDFPAWCRESGHLVTEVRDRKNYFHIFVRKGLKR